MVRWLTTSVRSAPSLVENGYVYIAQPPLYRLGRGKSEKYFADDAELNNYLFQQASSIMEVQVKDGELINGDNLITMLKELSLYRKLIDYLQRLNIWEELTNFLLSQGITSADQFCDEESVSQLRTTLQEENCSCGNLRPCRWKPSCYEFDAALKDKAHLFTVVGPQIPLINEYRTALTLYPRLKDIVGKEFTIKLIGKEKEIEASNWQDLLDSIKSESFRGYHFQRYKGLGEMNPEQLWETTMDPQGRILLQVSIDNAEAADDIFTTLMGDKVEPRRDFIYNHALEVADIDI